MRAWWRRGALAVGTALLAVSACSACSSPPADARRSASAAPSPLVTVTAGSAKAAAWRYRLREAAASGRTVAYLEYVCSVTRPNEPGTVYIALHERTTGRAAGSPALLDEVLAQPVTAASAGAWVMGRPIPVRSARGHRLDSDALAGLALPGHRCSTTFLGPPFTTG